MSVARFKTPSRPPSSRPEIYELSVKLSREVESVVQRITSEERFFLRDQLDRKSTTVPQLIQQGLRCDSLVERRAVYANARRVAQDCLAVLDALGARNTVEPAALTEAQASARALIEALGPLTVPPPLP